jgi:hypothetical protein
MSIFRPELPEILPSSSDERVRVSEEEHKYQVYGGSGVPESPQTTYILKKAPVDTIEEVIGIYDSSEFTFEKGVDYSLSSNTSNRTDVFTYKSNKQEYTLSSEPDTGSVVVSDDSTTYSDYTVIERNGAKNVIKWDTSGNTPNSGADFRVDYTVTFPNTVIEWNTAEKTPDADTFFYVTYTATSVMSRYVDVNTQELSVVGNKIDKTIDARFIDKASGKELDRIGKSFGFIGERRGRSDGEYRTFLKSIVQAFKSRGTNTDVKEAISAGIGVDLDKIEINEDFDNNSYTVEIVDWQDTINSQLLREMADIADPSGINQTAVSFLVGRLEIEFVISYAGNTATLVGDFDGQDAFDGGGSFGGGRENGVSGNFGTNFGQSFNDDVILSDYTITVSVSVSDEQTTSGFGSGTFNGASQFN